MTEFKNLIDLLQSVESYSTPQPSEESTNSTVDEEAIREKKIKNDNAQSDQKMKEKSLDQLFHILIFEIACIFLLAIFQGFGGGDAWFKFHIDEWCFTALATGVIIQTIFMLKIAIKHLFPDKKP